MSGGYGSVCRTRRASASFHRMAVVAAMAACAVLVAGMLAGCASSTSQEPSQKIQTMLQERWKAMNTGDTTTVGKAFAANALLDNYADFGTHSEGSAAIAAYFEDARTGFDMQWAADGAAIQYDKYVIQPIKMYGTKEPSGTGRAVHIMEIDANSQIAHEWIVGWAAAPPEQ